jgi:drug/metabolite transporter (DMT)-like permease
LLLASFSWALGSIYSGQANMPKSPLMGSGVEMVAGGMALVLLGLATGEPAQVNLSGISLRSGLAFLYLIIFGSLIGYTSYSWLLHNAPPALISTYAYVNPVVAVFLGWALAGEPLTPQILLGAAVIIVSVAIITTQRARRNGRRRRVAERGLETGD